MKPSEVLKFSRPLWRHQETVLDWSAGLSEVALLHEMGTGKTTSAIAWYRAKCALEKSRLHALVISPIATLYNWREEFERNAPAYIDLVQVLDKSGERNTKLLNDERSGKRIFITNPEALGDLKFVTSLYKKGFEVLIVDEAHRFKNPKSKRLQNLLSFSDRIPLKMLLTGTPILNSYLDIWAQWRVLDGGKTFGQNFFVFRDTYFRDANAAWKSKPTYFPSYVPKPECAEQVSQKIAAKSSRLTKLECLTLPPLLYVRESVPLSPEQRRTYLAMETELVAEVQSGVCAATNALVRVLRMLQILSGFLQVESDANEKHVHRLKENPRLARLTELLEELTPAHKVIVWCTFKENYAAIAAVCEQLKIPFATLTGETRDRQAEIDRFQNDPLCRVMCANPQAGGVGVNLTQASYAVYYSRSYSLGDRLQSEARNHRGGSEIHEKITIIDLVAQDTLDEHVLSALLRKENFADNVLDKLRALR